MGRGEAVQDRKLFIGGLAPQTDEDKLREFYSKWGDIVDLVVMKDGTTGRSRGFGFVTYSEASMAEQAVSDGPHEIDGKSIDTKRAISKDAMEDNSGPTQKVFVGGLKREITSEQVNEYFQKFGPVKEALVMTEKETGESRGFAFVTFEDTESVERVMEAKPHDLCGSQIDVQKAVTKEEMRKKNPRRGAMPPSRSNGRGGRDSYSRGPPGGYYGMDPYYGGWGGYGGGGYGGYGSDYYGGGGGYYDQYAAPYGDYGSQQSYGGGPMRGHYGDHGGGGYGGSAPGGGKPPRQPYGRPGGDY